MAVLAMDGIIKGFFFFSLDKCNVISNWEDLFFNGSPEIGWVVMCHKINFSLNFFVCNGLKSLI